MSVRVAKTLNRPMAQMPLPGFNQLTAAVEQLARADEEGRGAVFTKRAVVEFILDLVGYRVDEPLLQKHLLEPSFGAGDFILVAVERLLLSFRNSHHQINDSIGILRDCLRGVELHHASYDRTRKKLQTLLQKFGFEQHSITVLLDAWLIRDDYLLTEFAFEFTHIVGNPPYVRQELIPKILMEAYRSRFHTIYDRADLYVPFIEKSLHLLKDGGVLGFICSDRWMKNRYGGPLRKMVTDRFRLKYYVDMVDTLAFHSDVIAYPAITVIANEQSGPTRIAKRPSIDPKTLAELADTLTKCSGTKSFVQEVDHVPVGDDPWILESFSRLAVVRRLEETFPTLEEAGCRVGIGVATGADRCFIAPFDNLDVEPDRKLPLATTKDLHEGNVVWSGQGIINPFDADGTLVPLENYPKFSAYLKKHEDALRSRYVAKRSPHAWYRTIDRIDPVLAGQPKLLIPDIKGEAHVVYENGQLYPHHNLYFITSEKWDLRALQGLLLSGIAQLFVSLYSTKMRGGYLRFQAQYLRRIRIPRWEDVSEQLRQDLIVAAENNDLAACNKAACMLYSLNKDEQMALTNDMEQQSRCRLN